MRRRDLLRPELMAVRPVPVSAWPSIADIPIGAPVLDSDGVVKLCRSVAELNGPDLLKLPVLATDLRFVPWEIEWICNDMSANQSMTNRLIQILNNSGGYATSALVYKTTQTTILFEFRNSSGVGLFSLSGTVPNSGYFKIKIAKSGITSGSCNLYVNNVLQSSIQTNYNNWAGADQISDISMTDLTADLRPYRVFNYKASINDTLIDYIKMDELSGLYFMNQCNQSRPASLSDSGAHAKDLIQISML